MSKVLYKHVLINSYNFPWGKHFVYLVLFNTLRQIHSGNSSFALAFWIKLQHTTPFRKQNFIHYAYI